MSLQDEMLKVKGSYQINNLFVNLTSKNKRITLWQNPDNIHRICARAVLHKFDLAKEEMIFLPLKGHFRFSASLPLYFLESNKIILFKHFIFFNSDLRVVVKKPNLIMLKNFRSIPRSDVRDEDLTVSYSYGTNRDSQFEHLGLRSKLLDFNEGGLAFKSSLSNIIRFSVGETINIKSLVDNDKVLKGIISYITTAIDTRTMQHYYRVGVKFVQ